MKYALPIFSILIALIFADFSKAEENGGFRVEGNLLRDPSGRIIRYYKCRYRTAGTLINQIRGHYGGYFTNLEMESHADPWQTYRGNFGNPPPVDAGTREWVVRMVHEEKDWPLLSRLLSIYDSPKKEVIVKTRIIELTSERDFQLGFDASFSKTSSNNDSVFRAVDLTFSPEAYIASTLPGRGNFQGATAHFDNNGKTSAGRIGRGILDVRTVQTESENEVRLMPEIRAEEGVSASVSDSRQLPVSAKWISGGTVVGNATTFKDVGVTLWVRPQVIGLDSVVLDVSATMTIITPTTIEVDFGIQNPVTNTRKASTTVFLHDGEEFIFGGLVSRTQLVDQVGVPFLSDIPILGWFFRRHRTFSKKSEIYFHIVPTILSSRSHLELDGDIGN
ncbi:MAG: type II and III secretion system protein [Planctomycetes bacterium]|nr:type II and III secretion system protein [Planctomycetota bacterium]